MYIDKSAPERRAKLVKEQRGVDTTFLEPHMNSSSCLILEIRAKGNASTKEHGPHLPLEWHLRIRGTSIQH